MFHLLPQQEQQIFIYSKNTKKWQKYILTHPRLYDCGNKRNYRELSHDVGTLRSTTSTWTTSSFKFRHVKKPRFIDHRAWYLWFVLRLLKRSSSPKTTVVSSWIQSQERVFFTPRADVVLKTWKWSGWCCMQNDGAENALEKRNYSFPLFCMKNSFV